MAGLRRLQGEYHQARLKYLTDQAFGPRRRRQNGSILICLARTTAMSNPNLPSEIVDYIVDILHDSPETLKECCLVSKSWVPRTRKYLFADIHFRSPNDLKSWKETFPDPSNSPAYYHTHTLTAGCVQSVTAADAEADGWITTFSRVVRLKLYGSMTFSYFKTSLTLKSLHVNSTLPLSSQIFSLVRSLPLLEDLSLASGTTSMDNYDDLYESQTVVPPPPPPLTGSLELFLLEGMRDVTRRLLDLPGGLRFRKLTLSWLHAEDLLWIMELVARCSNTLECLDVMGHLLCASVSSLALELWLAFVCR